jgi:glycosyltransferase involved in cell wall biosynthesis
MGASSRLRTFQYRPYLEALGMRVETAPFFDDAYLSRLYAGERQGPGAVRHYVDRGRQLLRGRRADLIWLEIEALPWLPWLIERRVLPAGVPLVTDYDDAVFHRYDRHGSPLVRSLLGRKIDRLMAHSDLVLVGNAYLAERATRAGARVVEIVPTVVDVAAYQPLDRPSSEPVTIGWIGSPSTWDAFVAPLLPDLAGILDTGSVRFRAVGASLRHRGLLHADFLDWTEETEIGLIQGMDIGIMPLPDTPWTRGKCGYKLIQYMACGLPVIASPVGVNREIVEHGVNGFLAATPAEWHAALGALIADRHLRRAFGQAGRATVERAYSLQVHGPRVARLLASALGTA